LYIFAIYMKNIFNSCTAFNWDAGNSTKNWIKHQVSITECEQTFFNEPIIVYEDKGHSENENRYFLLGKTNKNRLLLIVFTIRNHFIRVISARDMSKKEREIYESEE